MSVGSSLRTGTRASSTAATGPGATQPSACGLGGSACGHGQQTSRADSNWNAPTRRRRGLGLPRAAWCRAERFAGALLSADGPPRWNAREVRNSRPFERGMPDANANANANARHGCQWFPLRRRRLGVPSCSRPFQPGMPISGRDSRGRQRPIAGTEPRGKQPPAPNGTGGAAAAGRGQRRRPHMNGSDGKVAGMNEPDASCSCWYAGCGMPAEGC